jgi:phosphoribosylformylglycinamidine synthase
VERHATVALKREGDVLVLIGRTEGWLGQSLYLSEIAGREEGAPPPVDLAVERRNGDVVRGLITAGRISACHDLSDGGLAVALAEMAMAGGIGATIEALPAGPAHALLFGEDQARYLVTVPAASAEAVRAEIAAAGVPVTVLGRTGGAMLALAGETPVAVSELKSAHETWLPAYMAGKAA